MTIQLEEVRCNLCGSDRSQAYLTRGDLNLFIPGEFQLVRCLDCGLVYQNPRPAPQSFDAIYPREYDQYTPPLREAPLLKRIERTYGLRKRFRAIRRHKAGGRLLDIGCSTGDFLEVVQSQAGWQVSGVEPNPEASRAAQGSGLDVKNSDLEPGLFPEECFEVVTLWNTIEHLVDPLGTLRLIHRLLKPGGLLVFNTPDLDSLDARIYRRYWIGFELPRHFYVFSHETLVKMLAKAGFRVVERKCLYGSHAANLSSLRFWLRAQKINPRLRAGIESFLFSRFFRLICTPYFFTTDRLNLSTAPTLFCVKEQQA